MNIPSNSTTTTRLRAPPFAACARDTRARYSRSVHARAQAIRRDDDDGARR